MFIVQKWKQLYDRAKKIWNYCSTGVWYDPRNDWRINTIKTFNLSVRSFFNSDIQSQACAMTYRTILAIVPALALVFAFGRGFGFQDVIKDELMKVFPAQQQAISYALNFVDSYLDQSSGGVFLGIGIVFLLWTLISLLGSVESTFNLIWGVKEGRSMSRKIIDYTAILLFLPIVMICASGLTLLLSSTLRSMLDFAFLSPLAKWGVEISSWIMTWIFFALVYLLMPNTKVKFLNALISGIFAGSGFLILQWIFVSGQMYVARYNAIYGSFSFLPLMLIWLQFTYVITFAGGIICYSSQNIFMFSFDDAIKTMSSSYYARIVLAISAVVTQRFVDGKGPTKPEFITEKYGLPPRLVSIIGDKLISAGIFSLVEIDSRREIKGYSPGLDPQTLTVAEVFNRLEATGASDFLPTFENHFSGITAFHECVKKQETKLTETELIVNLKID